MPPAATKDIPLTSFGYHARIKTNFCPVAACTLVRCARTCCAEKLESAFAVKKIRGGVWGGGGGGPHPPLSPDLR